MELNERIKASGLQKKFIAKQVGIDPATLSRIIRKNQPASDNLLQKINRTIESTAAADRFN